MGFETVLPPEHRLNAVLEEQCLEVDDQIRAVRKKTAIEEYLGDIIDPDIEFKHLDNLRGFVAFSHYVTDVLVDEFDYEISEEQEREGIKSESLVAYRAIYRGTLFAVGVVQTIYGVNARMDVGEYFREVLPSPDRTFLMESGVEAYLEANRNVAEHINKYISEIVENPSYNYHALIAAGLVFMLTERAYADDFITQVAANVAVEDVTET